ncbi:hypothetical protein GPECTOR_41g691 [Gonium pectorale]|uniref:Uncharacterized protein n=1 Tax=Gonium pectorale TaxID=33097 RepID=A0A150GA53_GONPE|nr:hypothetical protein GPECTOR_41g691 [Gonium pectorale]|eukprot:KXZ46726.1 hypothetical protein GPECTOR_41g691 [Gonium pectorale]
MTPIKAVSLVLLLVVALGSVRALCGAVFCGLKALNITHAGLVDAIRHFVAQARAGAAGIFSAAAAAAAGEDAAAAAADAVAAATAAAAVDGATDDLLGGISGAAEDLSSDLGEDPQAVLRELGVPDAAQRLGSAVKYLLTGASPDPQVVWLICRTALLLLGALALDLVDDLAIFANHTLYPIAAPLAQLDKSLYINPVAQVARSALFLMPIPLIAARVPLVSTVGALARRGAVAGLRGAAISWVLIAADAALTAWAIALVLQLLMQVYGTRGRPRGLAPRSGPDSRTPGLLRLATALLLARLGLQVAQSAAGGGWMVLQAMHCLLATQQALYEPYLLDEWNTTTPYAWIALLYILYSMMAAYTWHWYPFSALGNAAA